MPETTTPSRLSMAEARRQQHDKQRAIAENARRRAEERRERLAGSLRSALARHGIDVADDHDVVYPKPRPDRPDVVTGVSVYTFGWNAGANQLMLNVPPPEEGHGDEAVWVACSPPSNDYPLAWLAETWDRGLERIEDARRRRAEQQQRREHAENLVRDPEPAGPEPWTIARESPMGQLIAGLVDVISAAGGHGQLW